MAGFWEGDEPDLHEGCGARPAAEHWLRLIAWLPDNRDGIRAEDYTLSDPSPVEQMAQLSSQFLGAGHGLHDSARRRRGNAAATDARRRRPRRDSTQRSAHTFVIALLGRTWRNSFKASNSGALPAAAYSFWTPARACLRKASAQRRSYRIREFHHGSVPTGNAARPPTRPGKPPPAAAALRCARCVPCVEPKVFQRDEQEGAEPAFVRCHGFQRFEPQKLSRKNPA